MRGNAQKGSINMVTQLWFVHALKHCLVNRDGDTEDAYRATTFDKDLESVSHH